MKRLLIVFGCFLFICSSVSSALAVPNLYDWAFNLDGTVTTAQDTPVMPASGILDGNDLGTLTITMTGVGTHSFDVFFDYEIDEADNTYFNEYGSVTNTAGTSQSWEIDEPGYQTGDIYDNFLLSKLDKTNAITDAAPDDVSWAMGWDFTLLEDEMAIISLIIGDTAPASGFYLGQIDPDSDKAIYFSSTIRIEPVPEPGTMILVGLGVIGMVGFGRKKRLQ